MAILDVKTYREPVLKGRAQEVKKMNEDIRDLVANMKDTMMERDGVGLAAPQVGVSKRVIIVQTKQGIVSFINPRIAKRSRATSIEEEGCLSVPGIRLKIKRAKEVE